MKYTFIFLINLFFQNFFIVAQNKLIISGQTKSFPDGTVITISTFYPINTFYTYPTIKDSAVINEGKFILSILNSETELYKLTVKKPIGKEIYSTLFLEPTYTEIFFKDSLLNDISVTHNNAAEDYFSFSAEIQKVSYPDYYFTLFNRYDSIRNTNPELAKEILFSIDSITVIINKSSACVAKKWMELHSKSAFNSYIIYNYLYKTFKEESLSPKFNHLTVEAKQNSWGKELGYIVKNVTIGDKPPSFTQSDTSGRMISLKSFTGKGKYILIDFWASWCGPCRDKNPFLRKIYNDFRDKNFQIIGISLDKSKEQWMDAIQKDSLPWINISDLKYWKNEAAKAYYVRSIPSQFLLDPEGRIIGRDFSLEELRVTLMICL